MKMEYRTPFPNVSPLFVFTLCVAACCTAATVESAEPASNDHTYRWRHPPLGPIKVHVCPTDHPATSGLNDFVIEDELFLFRDCPQDNHVLLDTVFEGKRQPLAWTRNWGKGRVLHIALGHGTKAAENSAFQQLIVNGFAWLASD